MNKPPKLVVTATPDDLPVHLRGYCTEMGKLAMGWWFHHPLYVAFFPLVTPLPVEEMLKVRKDAADVHKKARNWTLYLHAHERPYRLPVLIRLAQQGYFSRGKKQAVEFWKQAAEWWVDAEMAEDDPVWGLLMEVPLPFRERMTCPEGRRRLEALPQRVEVYRGVHAEDDEGAAAATEAGWSWTLQRHTAEWFARRFLPVDKHAYVTTSTVDKSHIAALLLNRGEAEVLVPPGTLMEIESVERITRKKDDD